MGIFAKHLGQGNTVEIEGETYTLKPLGTEFLPHILKLGAKFSNAKTSEQIASNLDEDSVTSIQTIIDKTLELSFPDEWKNNESEVRSFGLKYFSQLMGKIFELNSSPMAEEESKKINELKEVVQKANVK